MIAVEVSGRFFLAKLGLLCGEASCPPHSCTGVFPSSGITMIQGVAGRAPACMSLTGTSELIGVRGTNLGSGFIFNEQSQNFQ